MWLKREEVERKKEAGIGSTSVLSRHGSGRFSSPALTTDGKVEYLASVPFLGPHGNNHKDTAN